MDMQIRQLGLYLLLGLVFVLTACSKNLRETTLENPDASYRLVIAGDSSDFKDSIRERLVNNYKDICHIDVINLDKLAEIDSRQYNAVLIMDTFMAWGGFNTEVKKFIDSQPDNSKIIVFFSAGDEEATYSYNGVDAITSASVPSEENAVVDELTQKIDLLLAEKK